MPQKPADILGYHFFLDIEVNQTIPFMAPATIIEITIKREKRRSVQLMKQRDNVVVFQGLPPKVSAKLPVGNTLFPQQVSLTFGDVFIQDIHAGRDSWAYSAA